MILYSKTDVGYLPKPNRVEFIVDPNVVPLDLNPTAFMIPFTNEESFVIANNRRRGLEIPGGHIDPGETAQEAAIRECVEETGYRVTDIKPLGYLCQTTEAPCPADYRYPWPLSYQQFFVGRVVGSDPYAENDECLEPVVLTIGEAMLRLDPNRFAIYAAALNVFRGA